MSPARRAKAAAATALRWTPRRLPRSESRSPAGAPSGHGMPTTATPQSLRRRLRRRRSATDPFAAQARRLITPDELPPKLLAVMRRHARARAQPAVVSDLTRGAWPEAALPRLPAM